MAHSSANNSNRRGVSRLLQRIDRRIWPFVVLIVSAVIIYSLFASKPQTSRRPAPSANEIAVEVLDLNPVDYQLTIESFGTVQPRTQSFLVAQVSGMVTSISDNFRDGAFLNKGDLLLQIDDRDYLADKNIAEASLAEAQRSFSEEQARADQALLDWQRLGQSGEPSDLVLRKPQLQAAKARVLSAQSALDKAQLSLERTEIFAPFDGRLIRSFVDVGQVVGNNMQVGEIYATDYVEVRLPLRDSDIPLVELPEEFREDTGDAPELPPVLFRSGFNPEDTWQGQIVRVESTIDPTARQLHVVAQIDNPFAKGQSNAIKIGQYVTAEIQGKVLSDVVVIPDAAIYQNSFVYIAEEGVLQRRDIKLEGRSGDQAIVSSGLQFGDRLVLTPMGQVTSGTRIRIDGETPARQHAGKRPSNLTPEQRAERRAEKQKKRKQDAANRKHTNDASDPATDGKKKASDPANKKHSSPLNGASTKNDIRPAAQKS